MIDTCTNLKGHYRHDQSSLLTGHGIGVLVKDEHSDWLIYAAAMVIRPYHVRFRERSSQVK